MAFPSFTSTEATPITIRKNTLLTGGVFSNQAMRVDYSVPDSETSTGFPITAFVSFQIGSSCTVADATLLYLYQDWATAPSGSSRMLRFDDNGTYPADSFIEFNTKSGAHGPAAFLKFNHTLSNCYNIAGTPSSISGYLTCDFSGTTRYIALYSGKS